MRAYHRRGVEGVDKMKRGC